MRRSRNCRLPNATGLDKSRRRDIRQDFKENIPSKIAQTLEHPMLACWPAVKVELNMSNLKYQEIEEQGVVSGVSLSPSQDDRIEPYESYQSLNYKLKFLHKQAKSKQAGEN